MDAVSTTLLALAVLAAAVVAVASLRRPILARMALRNAFRRPRQTLTVIAGLMIGTAIISSSLVASDSARGAIRGYVYQSLGEVDESVALLGYPFFPQAAYDEMRSNPDVASSFDAVSAHAIWQGAVETPSGLFEPDATLIGFEPDRDASFGTYHLLGGGDADGRDLKPGEAIATAHLAAGLELAPGDRVKISYTLPIDPILPRIFKLRGNVTASLQPPPVPGLPPVGPVQPVPSTHSIPVNRSASFLFVALGWSPAPAPGGPLVTSLQASLTSPSGKVVTNSASSPPLLLNVTAAPDATVEPGGWTLRVWGNVAANTPYAGAVVVGYPVYDPALLEQRGRALQNDAGELRNLLPGLTNYTATRTANVTVVAVTDGGRGSLFDRRDALFMRLDDTQRFLGREGQVNLIKFSNPGDQVSGEGGTDAAVTVLKAALDKVNATYGDVASVRHLEVKPLKREFLVQADAKGVTLTGLLLFAGSLSVITGLLLILNIFTMLVEERRSELGMARAVGLTRNDLVRLFLFEGSLYAVAAAAAGAVLGLGLAYVMVQVMNQVVARLSTNLSFPAIQFTPSWSALLLAFSLGALVTFVTILLAARRASRLNVVRAIRRIEEPERAGRRLLAYFGGAPIFAAGLAVSVLGWIPGALAGTPLSDLQFTCQVFGPFVLVVGLGLLLRPYMRRRHLMPLLAGGLALYYVITLFAISRFDDTTEANIVGPLRGVLMAFCGATLVVYFDAGARWLGRALSRLKALRPIALPAVSYPLHKKFRTGMTLALFAVVLLAIGVFSVFGAVFQADPARQSGSFDIEARPTLLVPSIDAYDAHRLPADAVVTARIEMPEYRTENRKFITVAGEPTGTFRDYRQSVFGYDAAFVREQRFHLTERLPAYADDDAAYNGVLARTDQVIVSYLYSTSADGQAFAHHAGDTLTLHLGTSERNFTIAGIQEQYHFAGVFIPRPLAESLFPGAGQFFLFKVQGGSNPATAVAAAHALEENYRGVGLDAKAIVPQVLDEQESFRQLLGAMQLFLGLGLVVGVLSLAIVTSRGVLERRQEIGMMRALGFRAGQVRAVFFIEVTSILLAGALVGITCAVLVTYGLWFAVIRQLNYPYVVPWAQLLTITLVSYVVTLIATWAPIGRAGRVAPAEALRYVE
jgi:putative ABC transport system permease protein